MTPFKAVLIILAYAVLFVGGISWLIGTEAGVTWQWVWLLITLPFSFCLGIVLGQQLIDNGY